MGTMYVWIPFCCYVLTTSPMLSMDLQEIPVCSGIGEESVNLQRTKTGSESIVLCQFLLFTWRLSIMPEGMVKGLLSKGKT